MVIKSVGFGGDQKNGDTIIPWHRQSKYANDFLDMHEIIER